MIIAFILATSLTAISDKRKYMGGLPEATSRVSAESDWCLKTKSQSLLLDVF